MGIVSFTIAILTLALEANLLLRAWLVSIVGRFPLFYSYITYVLISSLVALTVYYRFPKQYQAVAWFLLMVTWVAEFAVLLEVSDHIFEPYPSIGRLGRLLTACICTIFFFAFILPSLLGHQSRRVVFLDLSRSAFLTKAALIVVLLAAIRLYELPLRENISGMLLGFSVYLALNVVNVALDERFYPSYVPIFAVVGPSSYVLALTIWNVALWRFEPVVLARPAVRGAVEDMSDRPGDRLGRHETVLMRLFRR
jgi:hypothetical protein